MKKYGLIILAGILSAAIFKEPCLIGPMFGAMVALVAGIPFFLILSFLLRPFIKKEAAEKTARCLTILSIIALFWLLFQMPGWLRFRLFIANPPPPSVKNIHARWINGAFDNPSYIKFEISKTDLDAILADKEYETVSLDQFGNLDLLNQKWFNLQNIERIELYRIIEQAEDNTSEYIVYDPVNCQAVRLWHSWD